MTLIKSIILATATVAASASLATANNSFPTGESFEASDTFRFDVLRADGPGVLAIYDYSGGERGKLLGTEEVRAGVNTDVKVNLGLGAFQDVLAVLSVNGQEVLIKDYDAR